MTMAQDESGIMAAYTVVFDGLAHLGPGDSVDTLNLAERLSRHLSAGPRVADFGCGVGASTLPLAQTLPKARVLALDSHAPFTHVPELSANGPECGRKPRTPAVVHPK